MTVRARVRFVLTSVPILILSVAAEKLVRLHINVAYGRKEGFRKVKCVYNAH